MKEIFEKILNNKIVKILLNILKVLVFVILIGFILITVYQRIFPNSNGVFGYRTFVIVSNSMSPELTIGDVILVKQKPIEDITFGDIISYQGMSGDFEGKVITHKVEQIKEEENHTIFYTRGEANTALDPAVYDDQVYGVVIYKFIFFSIISKIIRNTFGFILLIVIPLIYIYYSEIMDIKNRIKERKKITEEEEQKAIEEENRLLDELINNSNNPNITTNINVNEVNTSPVVSTPIINNPQPVSVPAEVPIQPQNVVSQVKTETKLEEPEIIDFEEENDIIVIE